MMGSFGVFPEKNFGPNFFFWWQPSTPQPGPKRPLVAPRNPKGRPQGCIIGVQCPKLKKWHFESKNGIFYIKYRCWHAFQVFQVGRCHLGQFWGKIKKVFSEINLLYKNVSNDTNCNLQLGLRGPAKRLLGPGWGVLGCHQQKKLGKIFFFRNTPNEPVIYC